MFFPVAVLLFGRRLVQFLAASRGIVVLDTTAQLTGGSVIDLAEVDVVSYERWLLGLLAPTFGIFALIVEGQRYETFLTKQQLAELSATDSIPKRLMAESGLAA